VFISDGVAIGGEYPLLVEQRVFLRGGAGAQLVREISEVDGDLGGRSEIYVGDATLTWQPGEKLSLALRYQYRRQDADPMSMLESLTANTVMLSVAGFYPRAGPVGDLARRSQRVDRTDSGDPFGLDAEKTKRPE
jgi:hypothetical protein